MYGGMIKVHYMFKIDNKAPVCLEKAVFRELIQPVIHIMNRVKILPGRMYNYFSSLCFYGNNLRSRKRIYSLLSYNRDFGSNGIVIS